LYARCVVPSFIFAILASGSVSDFQSALLVVLPSRFLSNRRVSSFEGVASGPTTPASRINRTTYADQSSPVSFRTMLFIAAFASSVVLSTPTVFPAINAFASAIPSTN
jgi:hypothetical protein